NQGQCSGGGFFISEGVMICSFSNGPCGVVKAGGLIGLTNKKYMRMHHSLEHLLTIPSFVGWIKRECSPREQKHWDEWESEDVAHVELAREARDIVEAARSEYVAPDPQVELQKLNRELRRRKRQRPEPRPA